MYVPFRSYGAWLIYLKQGSINISLLAERTNVDPTRTARGNKGGSPQCQSVHDVMPKLESLAS
jgi:hypothetical protein